MTAPLRVDLQTEGLVRRVRDLRGRFASQEPIMRGPVRRLVRDAIVRQFATRGSFGGSPWPALAASTIAEKRRLIRTGKAAKLAPMRRTDRLFRSLTIFSHPERKETVTPTSYGVRSLVPYGKYHQSTAARASNLPRRAVVPDTLPPDVMTQLRNLVKGYIVSGEVAP